MNYHKFHLKMFDVIDGSGVDFLGAVRAIEYDLQKRRKGTYTLEYQVTRSEVGSKFYTDAWFKMSCRAFLHLTHDALELHYSHRNAKDHRAIKGTTVHKMEFGLQLGVCRAPEQSKSTYKIAVTEVYTVEATCEEEALHRLFPQGTSLKVVVEKVLP